MLCRGCTGVVWSDAYYPSSFISYASIACCAMIPFDSRLQRPVVSNAGHSESSPKHWHGWPFTSTLGRRSPLCDVLSQSDVVPKVPLLPGNRLGLRLINDVNSECAPLRFLTTTFHLFSLGNSAYCPCAVHLVNLARPAVHYGRQSREKKCH